MLSRTLAAVATLVLTLGACGASGPAAPSATTPAAGKDDSTSVLALVGRFVPDDDLLVGLRCSGVLVAPRVALTAAHCLSGDANRLDVVTGNAVCSLRPGARVRVLDARVLPGDVAVLTLASVPTDARVTAPARAPAPGDQVVALGFGASTDQATACEPRPAPVIERQQGCADALAEYGLDGDPRRYWCGTATSQGRSTCLGDSGGPVLDADGQLVGLVIAGQGCGKDQLGFFASPAPGWIEE